MLDHPMAVGHLHRLPFDRDVLPNGELHFFGLAWADMNEIAAFEHRAVDFATRATIQIFYDACNGFGLLRRPLASPRRTCIATP